MKLKRRKSILVFLCVAFAATASDAEESRAWTSRKTGRQFSGTLVKVEGDTIHIRRDTDKVVFQVSKSDLIADDLDWIEKSSPIPVEDLSALVSEIPKETGTPAVGVVLVEGGKSAGIGVAGVRKSGDTIQVEPEDKWHLGSCTKSFTATLAATFVEEGKIGWDTTISDILGEEVKMREEYESVTLGLLLANRSGITGDAPDSVYSGIETSASVAELNDRDLVAQRLQYVQAVLQLAPSSAPGSEYEYSNAGFVVAGAMLEQVGGQPWERLIEERIFGPLGMTRSGFGNAARGDENDPSHPWPHKDGQVPVSPGPGDDNPWVVGPAGTIHCSLADIARYLAMHATRETGPVLKKMETYEFLHTALPENSNYARGWIVGRAAWTGGPALSHNGSNTMNHCSIWIAPERGAAVAAFTNCDEQGSEVCRTAIGLVVEKYLE